MRSLILTAVIFLLIMLVVAADNGVEDAVGLSVGGLIIAFILARVALAVWDAMAKWLNEHSPTAVVAPAGDHLLAGAISPPTLSSARRAERQRVLRERILAMPGDPRRVWQSTYELAEYARFAPPDEMKALFLLRALIDGSPGGSGGAGALRIPPIRRACDHFAVTGALDMEALTQEVQALRSAPPVS